MDEWKEYSLKAMGSVITGKTPSKNNPEDWGVEVPFVTPSDYKNYRKKAFSSARNLSKNGIQRLKNKVLPPKSVLVTCIGSDMGKVVMNEVEVISNQQINSIIPDNNIVDNDFLYYCLVDMYEILRMYGGDGTAVPIVNKGDFENLETSLPHLPEQKAIASVLSSLDDKIDLLHRQNKILEAMAETLFRQWFVEEAEEGWEERKLGELVTITRGASPRPIVKYVKNGSVPWIKIADATGSNSFYINSTKEFIIEEGVSKSVQVFPGDLILSNSATCGLPFFVELDGCIHDGWLLFRDFSTLSKFFVFFFLKQINRQLDSIADGSVQNNLNTGILKEYLLKIPDEDTLKKFDESVKPIINKMKSNNIQIRILSRLRDTLLTKLMSGEVRVQLAQGEAAA